MAQLRRQARGDQVRQVGLGGPWLGAVVKHDREHRWERIIRPDLFRPMQVLVEEADVGEEPNGHEAVDGGLKLHQDVDVEPARLSVLNDPQTPDDIVDALTEVLADADLTHTLQDVEIQPLRPLLAHEAAEQIRNHLAMEEQQLVGRIVRRHERFTA